MCQNKRSSNLTINLRKFEEGKAGERGWWGGRYKYISYFDVNQTVNCNQ